MTILHPDGETIRVSKSSPERTDFDVEDLPEGRELSYPTVANGIGGVLNALAFEDVRAGSVFEGDVVTTTFETFDGDTIVVQASEEDGNHWIALSATAGTTDEEATGESKAEHITKMTDGWQYRVASYKANQLVRRWDDILQDPPADEEE